MTTRNPSRHHLHNQRNRNLTTESSESPWGRHIFLNRIRGLAFCWPPFSMSPECPRTVGRPKTTGVPSSRRSPRASSRPGPRIQSIKEKPLPLMPSLPDGGGYPSPLRPHYDAATHKNSKKIAVLPWQFPSSPKGRPSESIGGHGQ